MLGPEGGIMRFEACFGLLILACAAPADAGVFTDDLSRCVVQKTTDADRTLLVKWMFAAVTKNPALSGMASLSQADCDKLNAGAAALYDRIILTECRSQTIAALKNEGVESLGQAGQVLGGAAARQLMGSPEVSAEIEKMGSGIEKERWKALAAEAGLPWKDD
jgi:hypothetical protein